MGSKKSQKKQRRRGKRESGAERHDKSREQHSGGKGEWDAIRVPEGLEVFKPEKKKTYHIDLIPTVVGEHNKGAREGYEWWELTYYCYNRLGIDEKSFISLKGMLGKPDPVAEHFAALRSSNAEWDDMKAFNPQERQLMLVFVHEQADKGLQLYEASYRTFGKLLREEIDDDDREGVQNLDDPDGGATVVVRFTAEDFGVKNPWIKAAKINFDIREDGFDADGDDELCELILDKAAEITLDDCLKIPTYEQLDAALKGIPEPGEDDGPDGNTDTEPKKEKGRKDRKGKGKSKGKGKGKPAPPEEEPESEDSPEPPEDEIPMLHKGDKVEHDEHGTSTITRISKDGTCSLKDEDGDIQKKVPVSELTVAEVKSEKAPPKGKGKGKGKPDDKGGDDDWDDDWGDD